MNHSFLQLQYLATVVLILILGSYGFAQPFRLEAANVLEVVLSIDALILLLLRETTTVEDEMGMPSVIEASQIISSNSEGCTDALGDVTDFAWLLFPFYYFILIVTSAAAITWIVLIIRCVSKECGNIISTLLKLELNNRAQRMQLSFPLSVKI